MGLRDYRDREAEARRLADENYFRALLRAERAMGLRDEGMADRPLRVIEARGSMPTFVELLGLPNRWKRSCRTGSFDILVIPTVMERMLDDALLETCMRQGLADERSGLPWVENTRERYALTWMRVEVAGWERWGLEEIKALETIHEVGGRQALRAWLLGRPGAEILSIPSAKAGNDDNYEEAT